jgi:putative oxidoreductase
MTNTKNILSIIYGLFLLIFGLNGFLHFFPLPEMTEEAGTFAGSLAQTGYIFPIVGTLQVIVGILLIVNKFRPLALIVIFPIMLNAFLLHLFLDPAGIAGSLVAIIFNVFLFIANKESYKIVFQMNPKLI